MVTQNRWQVQAKVLQMIDKGFLLESISYFIIFVISTLVPIYIHKKKEWPPYVSSLMSILLTLFLINVFFQIGFYFHWPTHPAFQEFYEVFWLIPPIVVYLYCRYKDKKEFKESLRLRIKLFCYEHLEPVEMILTSERLIYTLKIQLRYLCPICKLETILLLSDIIDLNEKEKKGTRKKEDTH